MSSNNYNNHFTFDFVHSRDAELTVPPPSPAPPQPRRHLSRPPESKCSSFHLLSLRKCTWDNRPQFGYWKQDQHPATYTRIANLLLVSVSQLCLQVTAAVFTGCWSIVWLRLQVGSSAFQMSTASVLKKKKKPKLWRSFNVLLLFRYDCFLATPLALYSFGIRPARCYDYCSQRQHSVVSWVQI